MAGQLRYLLEDLKRWKCNSIRDYFYTFFEQGLWVTIFYRTERALFLVNIPILKLALRLIAFFMMKFAEIFLGAAVKPEANIGPGFYLGHTGYLRIHPKTIAGKNFTLEGTGTILGEKGLGKGGAPIIGDYVYIGTGSKILGSVHIGNNARVGANAVVVNDIPAGATAVGVPAKVIAKNNYAKEPLNNG